MFHVEHLGPSVVRELAKVVSKTEFSISAEQNSQLTTFASELLTWNEKTNLTAITGPQEIAVKHFLDSFYGLGVLQSWPGQVRLADIGAGAGFPGIPLRILRPDLTICMIEKSAKKCAFLSNVIGKLKFTGLSVCNSSVERISSDPAYAGSFTHVVVRAMDIHGQLNFVRGLLEAGGQLMVYSTPGSPRFEQQAVFLWMREVLYELPHRMGSRSIVVYQAI